MRKLICGKFDSAYKKQYKFVGDKPMLFKKVRGHFQSAMNYACLNKGESTLIKHARFQPWETWTKF